MIRRPPPVPSGPWALVALLAFTLAVGAAALPSLNTMDDRGADVFTFELAATSERAGEIVSEWGEEGRDAARTALLLDYPYLLGYGLLLAGACTALARRAGRRGRPRLATLGAPLAWGALAAATADAIENAALLMVAGRHTDQPWPTLAAGFAIAKFALVAAAALYLLAAVAPTLRR